MRLSYWSSDVCSSDFEPVAHPERGVEVRQRLVEQEQFGWLDDRARDRDALLLAARKLRRFAVEEGRDFERFGRCGDTAVDLVGGHARVAQAERHVLEIGRAHV